MNDPQPQGHMASYIGRRKFLATLGSASVAWPLTARAQQAERMRRLGVLMNGAATAALPQSYVATFVQGLRQAGWTEGRQNQYDRTIPASGDLRRSHPQGCEAWRSARPADRQVHAHHQPQNRQGARPPNSRQVARSCQRGHRMTAKIKRRDFITLLGGAAVAWPVAGRAQQGERMRRIGVLMNTAADDPESQARNAAFLQGLQELGWTVGRNVRIDYRWAAGDTDRLRRHAAE